MCMQYLWRKGVFKNFFVGEDGEGAFMSSVHL